MWDLVGIVRTDARLATAARRLALLREEIEDDYHRLRLSPDLIELRNIALGGEPDRRMRAARPESRGLHFNLDHPRPGGPRWRRPTVLKKAATVRTARSVSGCRDASGQGVAAR
jgi:L-aspartate oxidase